MSNISLELDRLYLLQQALETAEADIAEAVPALVAKREELKAEIACAKTDIKTRCKSINHSKRKSISGKWLQVVYNPETTFTTTRQAGWSIRKAAK
jgi:hypothetical protein